MTKENKFESLLELLINEENDKAEALFHEIVVEKSRDIYEGLADETTTEAKEETKEDSKEEVKETEASEEKVEETTEEKVEETTDEAKDEAVKETEVAQDEKVDEVVEIEDEATESEKTDEETIEEVGGDATDELVKDISADQEGEADMPSDMDMDKDDDGQADADHDHEDMEDRVVDLEDALDDLKAEFEKMMSDKGGDEEKEDESLAPVVPAEETQPEMSIEAKDAKKDKEDMKEYKNMAKADMSGGDDKSAKSPVASKGGAAPKASPVKMGSGADETGRPAPTAKSMNATTEPKMKEVKADTKDGSDKSAKSPVAKS